MALKAVLMAAGKSTRTYPLTLTRPKPLLKVANKFILQHNLEQLESTGLFDEAIIIIGYKGEMIRQQFGKKFGKTNLALAYVEQKEQLGTGHALLRVKDAVGKSEFMIMNGDDLFFADDLKNLAKERYGVLVKKVDRPELYGVYVVEKGYAKKLVEKPQAFISNIGNIGCYKLDSKVFGFDIRKSERGEFEITDFISELMKKEKVRCVEAKNWFPIGYAWDLLKANEFLLSKIKRDIKGEVEQNVVIKGEVVVGRGTLLKAGTYIEGPVMIGEDCTIGPNSYIRSSTSIGSSCRIGHETEIKNSIIMDHSSVPHLSYIGDSIIGENVNVAAGSVTANLRHDMGIIRTSMKKEVEGEIKEDLVDTGLMKFGTVIGDNARLGVKTIIYPGRKIWPGKSTLPGQVVIKDIE